MRTPRRYSKSWSYPGNYPGYGCHPEPPEEGICIQPPVVEDNAGCSSDYYLYIDSCKGYPFDLMDLDKPIDLMSNPENPIYDLNV